MWVNYVNDIKEKCFILVKHNNKQALEIDNYIKENIKSMQNLCLVNFRILECIKSIINGLV